jgi:hypothetical protein
MQINLSFDQSTSTAPSWFVSAIQSAANILGNSILNPVTVTIQVGWGEIAGTPLFANASGEGCPSTEFAPSATTQATNYAAISSALVSAATTNGASSVAANIPSANPFGGYNLTISTAEAKAFGWSVSGASGLNGQTQFDGSIGIANDLYAVSNIQGFTDLAIHELSHALGRANAWSWGGSSWYMPLDLFTYTAPGQLWTPSSSASGYFSLDDGKTNLGSFQSADPADFTTAAGDPFGMPYGQSGAPVPNQLTAVDQSVLQALGFDIATNRLSTKENTSTHAITNTLYSGDGTVVYSGTSTQYNITTNPNSGTVTVQDTVAGRNGTSDVTGVPRLQFADTSIAFDLGANQSGGKTAEIIGAAFGPSLLSNKGYTGIGISLFDKGYTMDQVAQLAIDTGHVAGGTATPSNSAFVRSVWQNVIGSHIDTADLTTFTGLLNSGVYTQAGLLAIAAETTANQNHVGLVGLASHGLDFTPA